MALTIKQVEDITTEFCREYPSAFALKFKIRNTQEELYGPQASSIPTISAGYHPHRGIVAIPAANLRNEQELRRTLRHEILGHYGLNTFVADDKRRILAAILRSRDEPSMRPLWTAVDRGYPAASPFLKAEEIFAFAAERVRPAQRYDLAPGFSALKTVLNDDKSTIHLRRLLALTTVVAQGLEQGTRLQRNFPPNDDALFSAEKPMSKQRTLGAAGAIPESNERSALESYHEKVAAKLVEQLKQGTAPWQRPIIPGSANSAFPYNPTTGANYRGMNMITLMAADRTDPRWMTYRQAEAQGAQVRKGERATPIQFWSFTKTRDALDELGKPILDEHGQKKQETVKLARPMVRFASVFNAAQIDGLKETQATPVEPSNTIERANEILAATGADIRHDQTHKMFYRPSTDTIHLPAPTQFRSPGDYYATAFHEVGHWTGHPDRLNRDLAHPFGSEGYAKEELRAEIASLMISQDLNLPHNPDNHASYVGSWIEVLQNDPREIFRAASDAEKIRGLVLGMHQKQEQIMEHNAAAPSLSPEPVQLAYQVELARLLGLSTLTPGSYTPTENVKSDDHAAVFVNDAPSILCGPSGDPTSVAQANALAASEQVHRLYQAADRGGPITSGVIAGSQIPWQGTESAVVAKASGKIETGGEAGPFVAIVLNDAHAALATGLCVTTETARILDSNAPDLDDGRALAALLGDDRRAGRVQEREYLNVPYAEKEAAKQLGAKWDRVAKAWYVPLGVDASPLARWASTPAPITATRAAATRLDPLTPIPQPTVSAPPISAEAGQGLDEVALIRSGAVLVRSLALEGEHTEATATLVQQFATDDLSAYQRLPAASTDRALALAILGENAALEATYAATLRSLDAAVAGAAQDAFHTKADSQPAQVATQAPAGALQDTSARAYLLVPYQEREQARAAGARWDAHAKSWYVGPKADHEKLAKWDRAGARSLESAPNPREEFAARLMEAGARVNGEHPIMDGATHRIPVTGDKPYERSGFYVGHLDDIRPAGYFKNNRSGEEFRWKAKGYSLTEEQKIAFVGAAAAKLMERENALHARHEQRAEQLAVRRSTLQALTTETRTPYLVAKNLPAYAGVYTDKEGETLFVPLMDAKGKQWSEQYIRGDGTKRLASEARKEGCFHVIDGFDRLKDAKVFVLAEGYSTAATIHESHSARVPVAVVAAVDAGNLAAVAKALRTEFPTVPIVVAGDDDRPLQQRENKNPGRTGALSAAAAVDGIAVFPIFDTKDDAKLTDFNDLRAESTLGADGLRRQLTPVIEKAGGFQEEAQEETIPKTRARTVRRRGPQTDDQSPRRIKRSIA